MASEPKYSSFTLNSNPAARAPKDENEKVPPSLRGTASVLINGQPTEFEVAAWGPFPASTGGPNYYNLTMRPKDPALAARQVNTQLKDGDVPNPIDGFELTRLGSGKFFERTDEEISMGKAAGKNVPKFYGHALVYTSAGPRAVDVAAWRREGQGRIFYSGNANLHDPKVVAAARAQSGRATTSPARRPQNG